LNCSALPFVLAESSKDDFNYIKNNFDFTPSTVKFYSRLLNATILVRFNMGYFWDVFRWKCLIAHKVEHGRSEQTIPINAGSTILPSKKKR
jgi:hypothetical protein